MQAVNKPGTVPAPMELRFWKIDNDKDNISKNCPH